MIGLFGYQAALLLRSYRWLPPLLVFAVVVFSATAGSPPPADAFGFAAAVLVPVSAWLVRLVATGEPEAARACIVAAGGAGRTQLSGLLVAVAAGILPALVSWPILLYAGVQRSSAEHPLPPSGQVLVAGLLGELACVLVGVAAGAVANPPVVRRPAAAVLATGLLVVVALVTSVSPARAAIRVVTAGGSGPTARLPLVALLAAGLLFATAAGVSASLARSRGVD